MNSPDPGFEGIFYIVYKTTCLLSGEFYVGSHISNSSMDDYIGSGRLLHQAIAKYGRQAFQRENLEFCSDAKSMERRERELIHAHAERHPNLTLNIQCSAACNAPLKSKPFTPPPSAPLGKSSQRRPVSVSLPPDLIKYMDAYAVLGCWEAECREDKRGGTRKGRNIGRSALTQYLLQELRAGRIRILSDPPENPLPVIAWKPGILNGPDQKE